MHRRVNVMNYGGP